MPDSRLKEICNEIHTNLNVTPAPKNIYGLNSRPKHTLHPAIIWRPGPSRRGEVDRIGPQLDESTGKMANVIAMKVATFYADVWGGDEGNAELLEDAVIATVEKCFRGVARWVDSEPREEGAMQRGHVLRMTLEIELPVVDVARTLATITTREHEGTFNDQTACES